MNVADDDFAAFETMKRDMAASMSNDTSLMQQARAVSIAADRYAYSYQWTWLGVPIIQMPPDILAVQEIIWKCKPQLIIETGVARGGSVIFYSSLLELVGEGEVIGVDIDIRAQNRRVIETHSLSKRIVLISGSSVSPAVVEQVRERASLADRVMVILDSNHTHDHVLAELELYAPLVTHGQYLIVCDSVIEDVPDSPRPRQWGPGNSPKSALCEYLAKDASFEVDSDVEAKLLMTASPGGYLRCTRR